MIRENRKLKFNRKKSVKSVSRRVGSVLSYAALLALLSSSISAANASVPCRQCFPVEELPVELQPKAVTLLKYVYQSSGLFTLVGGLKPIGTVNFYLKDFNLNTDDLKAIVQAFHCGSIEFRLSPSPLKVGTAQLDVVRVDRVSDTQIEFRDWFREAGFSEEISFRKILDDLEVIPSLSDLIIQIFLDLSINADRVFAQSIFQRQSDLIKKYIPDFNEHSDLMANFSLILQGPELPEILARELFKVDRQLGQKMMRHIVPILRRTHPTLSEDISVEEVFATVIPSHDRLAEKYNDEMRLHTNRVYGALVGYPRHAIEYFVERSKLIPMPLGQTVRIQAPSGEGAQFIYVVPEGPLKDEDLKLIESAKRIYDAYRVQKQRLLGEGNDESRSIHDQLSFFRSFYELDSQVGQCSPARLDNLR